MPSRVSPILLVLVAAVLAFGGLVAAGCGSDGGGRSTPAVTQTAPTGPSPSPSPSLSAADRAKLDVVRTWADALRTGDERRAARTFSLPARVANGGPAVVLVTRPDVRLFDDTLPCGAKVVGATHEAHGFLRVSFLLTERPGGSGCGAGVGNLAETAIRVRNGHITDWLRLPDPAPGPSTEL